MTDAEVPQWLPEWARRIWDSESYAARFFKWRSAKDKLRLCRALGEARLSIRDLRADVKRLTRRLAAHARVAEENERLKALLAGQNGSGLDHDGTTDTTDGGNANDE